MWCFFYYAVQSAAEKSTQSKEKSSKTTAKPTQSVNGKWMFFSFVLFLRINKFKSKTKMKHSDCSYCNWFVVLFYLLIGSTASQRGGVLTRGSKQSKQLMTKSGLFFILMNTKTSNCWKLKLITCFFIHQQDHWHLCLKEHKIAINKNNHKQEKAMQKKMKKTMQKNKEKACRRTRTRANRWRWH